MYHIEATRRTETGAFEKLELTSTGRAGGAVDLKINRQPLIQEANGCEWDAAKFFNRGNRKTIVTFSGHRTFTTRTLAAIWNAELDLKVNGLWNTFFYYDATRSKFFWLKDAVLVPLESEQTGIDIKVSWQVLGGRARFSLRDQS